MEAIILGIVQGVTEFLPISSSGHLVILEEPISRWLGSPQTVAGQNLQLNVALHLGTLFSILAVYRHDLRGLLRRPRLCLAIILATLPVVVVGFTLKDRFETLFGDPLFAGCCLLLTAVLLIVGQRMERGEPAMGGLSELPLDSGQASFGQRRPSAGERLAQRSRGASLDELSLRQALLIGLFQALAIAPGISRSGSTIAGGMVAGLRRDAAATFSFFIAVPAIAGAAVLIANDVWQAMSFGPHQGLGSIPADGNSLRALAVGMLTAFVVGFFALSWLLRLVSQRRLHWFAYYCGLLAAVTITWQVYERLT